MEAGDARGLFEDQPARLGPGRNDLPDLPLAHQRRRARASRSVGEQELHVARAHLLAVDAVGRTGVAFDAPRDLDPLGIVEGGRRAAVELSSRRPTSALLREGRLPEPAKMTSSMPEPRMFLNELSPITQRRASTRFDLPQPFGPTTPVKPGSILNSAASQKLLKPVRRKRSNFIVATPRAGRAEDRIRAGFRPSSRHGSPARIAIARRQTGFSGHNGVAQSTPIREKPVRNGPRARRGARSRAIADATRERALDSRVRFAI